MSTAALDQIVQIATPETGYRLNSMDRCDTCSAQAYIAANVKGIELLYCAHHGRKYEEKLRAVATSWLDETSKLADEKRTQGEP